jgi:heme exporter protein A
MLAVSQITLERYFAPVFEPVSFELAAGELLLVTGPNGSGKTTLLRLLAGLSRPSMGTIHRDQGLEADNGVAYIGHQPGIKDDLNVLENIRFMLHFHGPTEQSAEEVSDMLGLRHVRNQVARTLSAGQRKRCALARLFTPGRSLWLLDEPYSNLRAHLDRGGACVMSTHGTLRPEGFVYRECLLCPGTTGA